VGRVTARDVDVLGFDVHVIEEILPHEPVVAVDVVRLHGVILVEIEGHDVGKRQPLLAMHSNELAIHPYRCGAGGKAEDSLVAGGVFFAYERRDARCDEPRNVVVLLDDDGSNTLERRSAWRDARRPASHAMIAGLLCSGVESLASVRFHCREDASPLTP
jgi:hypothetical protein